MIHYCRGRLVILCWLSSPAEKIVHRPVFINLRNLCVQKCRLFPVQLRRQCPYLLNAGWTTFAVLSPKHMQDCNLRRTHGPGINYGNVMRASGCNLEACRYYACANIFPKKIQNLESDWSKRPSRQTTGNSLSACIQILSHVGRRKTTKACAEDQEASCEWGGEQRG